MGTLAEAPSALEQGQIVYPTGTPFQLTSAEQRLLSPTWLQGSTKNISFNSRTGDVRGTTATGEDLAALEGLLSRFSAQARDMVTDLFPQYREHLDLGLTSFRPAEVADRVSSWRKDDARLHVDAFPSRPLQGRRILRLFINVGPRERRWYTGEPFEQVVERFLPRVRAPLPATLWLLHRLHLTRGRRTLYDHYMLGLHDAMKADVEYQKSAGRTQVNFQPGTIWACYTDLVSHAVISGQFALEQTFYLPVHAMQEPQRSPLRILERRLGQPLV